MTRVLVPVEVLKGGSVSPGLMNLLGTVDVTVLGYHALPDQTGPDQARDQYEERATSALEDLCQEFQTAGGEADYRMVFTHNREQTINRIADEVNARAFAVSWMTGDVDNLLVSLSGDVAADRIIRFVEELISDRDIDVTLLLAAKDEAAAEERLESAAEQLRETGFTVQTESRSRSDPFDALLELVPGHDAIVIGENAPSFRSLIFEDDADRLASASVGPVLVVRYDKALDG